MEKTMQKVDRLPNERQTIFLNRLLPVLEENRNRLNENTFAIIRRMYFTPVWRRVRWAGGVGSWRVMKSGKLRLQISASVQGHNKAGILGYRYAWCVEF